MLFYLKVNLDRTYAIKNIQYWVEAIYLYENSKIYFVCDNPTLKKRILNEVHIKCEYDFLESNRSDKQMKYIIDNICNDIWKNAGYAHLTTFFHALSLNEDCFWNIDADDTRFCMDSKKICDMFVEVENQSNLENIDCISLDFYYTYSFSYGWSFGVSYINHAFKCIKTALDYISNKNWRKEHLDKKTTIDVFFRLIKYSNADISIEVFYVDNSIFIHYADDIFYSPSHGINCFYNGILFRPLFNYILGVKNESIFFISDTVKRIRVGSSIKDSVKFMREYTEFDVPSRRGDVLLTDFVSIDVICLFKYLYNHHISEDERIIFWGIGYYLRANWITLTKVFHNIVGFSDNDIGKWDKKIVNELWCFCPDELEHIEYDRIIVTVADKNTAYDIIEKLYSKYGINNSIWFGDMICAEKEMRGDFK